MAVQQDNKPRSRTALKLYFLLMTIAGIIGTLVSLGFFLYTIGKKVIITNNEYIVGERYYDLDTCTQNVLKPIQVTTTSTAGAPMQAGQVTTTATVPVAEPAQNYVAPTDAEIAKCKADKTAQLIEARNVLFKEDMLSGAIRTLLFFSLLMVHYPRFMRLNKKD